MSRSTPLYTSHVPLGAHRFAPHLSLFRTLLRLEAAWRSRRALQRTEIHHLTDMGLTPDQAQGLSLWDIADRLRDESVSP